MTARANTSSGPKADPEPTRSHAESHPVAYAIVSGTAVGLLLLLVGLLSDTHDTYFNEIGLASLVGGTIVAFFRLASRPQHFVCSASRFTRSFI